MKQSKGWRSSALGGFCLLLAAGVAGAQQGNGPPTPPARGSGGASTGTSNTGTSNMPAAASATTSPRTSQNRDVQSQPGRDANPGDPDPEGDPAPSQTPPPPPVSPHRAAPSEGKVPSEGQVPSRGWQMGAQGTLIQLEELAPVEIVDLQERLQALNLYHGAVDGLPGPQTRQALQQYFIKQAQLALQGQVDASALNLFDVIPTSHNQPL